MDTQGQSSETPDAGCSSSARVLLPVECTLEDIATLQSCLRYAPAGATLDGSAVRRIDAAGAKLLVAFMRARRAARHVDRWSAVSEVLVRTIAGLGLTTAINLPRPRR